MHGVDDAPDIHRIAGSAPCEIGGYSCIVHKTKKMLKHEPRRHLVLGRKCAFEKFYG